MSDENSDWDLFFLVVVVEKQRTARSRSPSPSLGISTIRAIFGEDQLAHVYDLDISALTQHFQRFLVNEFERVWDENAGRVADGVFLSLQH